MDTMDIPTFPGTFQAECQTPKPSTGQVFPTGLYEGPNSSRSTRALCNYGPKAPESRHRRRSQEAVVPVEAARNVRSWNLEGAFFVGLLLLGPMFHSMASE